MSDFESRLEATLKGVRDEHVQSIASELPAARQRIVHRTRRRRFGFVITTTAVTAAALVASLLIAQAEPLVKDNALPPASTTPVVVHTYELPDRPVDVVAGHGSAWVLTQGDNAWSLEKIDPAGTYTPGMGAGQSPSDGEPQLAMNDGYLFVASPGSGTIARHPMDTNEAGVAINGMSISPEVITASDDTLWYWGQAGDTSRKALGAIDLGDLTDLGEIYSFDEGVEVTSLAQTDDGRPAAFVHEDGHDAILHVPEAGKEEVISQHPVYPLSESVAGFEIQGDQAWAARRGTPDGDELMRVTLSSGISSHVGIADPLDVAVDGGDAWLLSEGDSTNLLAPVDLENDPEPIGQSIEVGSAGDGQVAVGEGYVWVTNVEDQTLLQIAPDGSPTPLPSVTPTEDEPISEPSPGNETDEKLPASDDALGIWPEHNRKDASERCAAVEGPSNKATESEAAKEVAFDFAEQVLGWDVTMSGFESSDDRMILALLHNADGNEMDMTLWRVAPLCWVVTNVTTANQDLFAPTGLSVGKKDGTLTVAVEIESRNIKGDIARVALEVPDTDGTAVRTSVVEPTDGGALFKDVRLPTTGPSYFLVLFEAADGTVLNALGMGLPGYDFNAG